MDTDGSETWYPDPLWPSIMVEIYQHQAFWDKAFSRIWQTEKRWVSFDPGKYELPNP